MKLNIEKGEDILLKVGQVAEQIGEQVYAVGGFVRDLYLGKEGTDIDFVVIDDALKFTRIFKKKYHAGKIVSFPRFGTARLIYRNYKLEFVTARSEHYESDSRKPTVAKADLKSDLSRRDFTINTLAMAVSPGHIGEVIDIYGGIEDIDCKMIKTPLDPVITFKDDPLRIMRAIRFAGKLNFKLDRPTYEAIIETRERLKIISQERITEEFNKILLTDKPSYGLKLMQELQLLDIVFPELSVLTGVDQRRDYHHKDVFEHTLQVVDNIAARSEKLELRLAALLHDIAKPQTKRFIEGAGWTFHGHEDLGARMVEEIGRRMKYPNAIIHYVKKLVRLHLRPMQLVDESVTDSAVRRLIVQGGEEIDDLMRLCRADITSKNPKKVQRYLTNFDIVEEKMKQVEEKDKLRNFRIAIDGHQIMKELNIPPGPVVGEIKQAITDAVLDGKIPNEYEACLKYLKKIKGEFLD